MTAAVTAVLDFWRSGSCINLPQRDKQFARKGDDHDLTDILGSTWQLSHIGE
jgi:hypothetical protein